MEMTIGLIISIIIVMVIIVAVALLLSGIIPGTREAIGLTQNSTCGSFNIFCNR